MPEVREAALDLDGTTLSYEERSGAGPAVVGLRGLGSSRAADVASGHFDESALAASGRRLIRYDVRGHGRSTGRPVPAEYAWPHLADDLLALLDAISPNEPVDAFGASMGVGTLLQAPVVEPLDSPFDSGLRKPAMKRPGF